MASAAARSASVVARAYTSSVMETDPTAVSIEDRLPATIAAVAKRSNRARREAERATARAHVELAEAAKELTELGLSRRDVAELLGMSHQRIQQILAVA